MKKLSGIAILFLSFSCNPRIADGVRRSDTRKDVEMLTDKGRIVLRLSDKTPLHRNNFIRLVKSRFYDSILFHRVIKGFVVQTGDPRTKPSRHNEISNYTIPAEFNPELFHKRGALNAARTGEETNPQQASSGTQFTMIQGKVFTDSLLDLTEKRVSRMNAYKRVLQDPANGWMLDKLKLYANQPDSARMIRDRIDTFTVHTMAASPAFHFSAERRAVYKTLGGAAHLDGNYTVFGEVVSGMDVVDSIASVQTKQDRPVQDVRVLRARLIKRKN